MNRKKLLIVILAVAAVLLPSCNLDVFNSVFDEQEVISPSEETQKPAFENGSPSYLLATKGGYTDKIVLSWAAVSGADYYEISRKAEGDAQFLKFPFSVTGTSYSDMKNSYPSLEDGKRYVYIVNACSNGADYGENTAYSPEASGSLLCPPMNLEAEKGKSTDQITLSWTSSLDARSYNVYRSDSQSFSLSDSFVASMPASDSELQKFAYRIDESESGKNLYFKVTAASSSGSVTALDDSPSALGYSLVFGAPSAPQNINASQGTAIDAAADPFEIVWDQDSAASSYEIYCSAPGVSEQKVFPYASDALEDIGGTQWKFTDKRARKMIASNQRYTYTIIPLSDDGSGNQIKGTPASVDAYLLSNPASGDIGLSLSANPLGYVLQFAQVVGLDDSASRSLHSDWVYVITRTTASGASDEVTIDPDDFGDTVTYQCPYEGADPYSSFSIHVENGTLSTAETEKLEVGAPVAPADFSVSSNRYIKGMTSNPSGVYPVHLSWTSDSSIDHYVIERFSSNGSQKIASIAVSGNLSSYDDLFDEAQPGIKYSYRIQAFDVLGRSSDFTEKKQGYGAITAKTLIKYWTIYAFKPWENSSSLDSSLSNSFFSNVNLQSYWVDGAINSRIQKGNSSSLSEQMGALGDETQTCHFAHGSHMGTSTSDFGYCAYHAATEGVGGFVSFTYKDFGELDWICTEDGYFEMHVDTSGTGSAKGVSFKVGGMYSATIGSASLSVQSKAFIGNYSVKMGDGQGTVSVPSSI